jgi:hypothetical protein
MIAFQASEKRLAEYQKEIDAIAKFMPEYNGIPMKPKPQGKVILPDTYLDNNRPDTS